MQTIVLSYLTAFTHPFKFADYTLNGSNDKWKSQGLRELSLTEAICTSWIFKIISGCLILMILSFSDITAGFNSDLELSFSSHIVVFYLGAGIVLFPVWQYIHVGIWKFLLLLVSPLYFEEGELEESIDDILSHAMSSHTVSAIPFIGGVLQETLWLVYIFAGFKSHYNLNGSQVFTLITFFTLISFFFILSLISLFLIIIFV